MAELSSIQGLHKQVNIWPMSLSVGNGGFFGSLKHYYGYNHIHRTAISSEDQEALFRSIMRGKKIKTAVEIGTYNGTTTALLAHYAEKVVTIDVKNYVDRFPFWADYGVYEKIDSYIVRDDEDKARLRSVLYHPGESTFTLIPCRPHSAASALVICTTPPRLAQ